MIQYFFGNKMISGVRFFNSGSEQKVEFTVAGERMIAGADEVTTIKPELAERLQGYLESKAPTGEDVDELNAEISLLNSQISSLQNSKTQLEGQVSAMNTEIKNLESQLSQADTDKDSYRLN